MAAAIARLWVPISRRLCFHDSRKTLNIVFFPLLAMAAVEMHYSSSINDSEEGRTQRCSLYNRQKFLPGPKNESIKILTISFI